MPPWFGGRPFDAGAPFSMNVNGGQDKYHLVMTNIAMENPL